MNITALFFYDSIIGSCCKCERVILLPPRGACLLAVSQLIARFKYSTCASLCFGTDMHEAKHGV